MFAQSTLNADLCFHSKSAFVISSSCWFFLGLRGLCKLEDRVGGIIIGCKGSGFSNRKGGIGGSGSFSLPLGFCGNDLDLIGTYHVAIDK